MAKTKQSPGPRLIKGMRGLLETLKMRANAMSTEQLVPPGVEVSTAAGRVFVVPIYADGIKSMTPVEAREFAAMLKRAARLAEMGQPK